MVPGRQRCAQNQVATHPGKQRSNDDAQPFVEEQVNARLLESLPVSSPLQVYTSSARYYPYGDTAAHTLGYVGVNSDIKAEDFSGDDLRTFKLKGSIGRDGLEKIFDDRLQGEVGGSIFRVDPSGYRINPPLEKRQPVQGQNLITSLMNVSEIIRWTRNWIRNGFCEYP